MALDPSLASKRIKAAREAIEMTQDELGSRFVDYDFGKHDIGKLERVDPTAPEFGASRINALVEITGFPEEWFTEPDISKIFGLSAPEPEVIDRLRQEFDEKLARLQQPPTRAEELTLAGLAEAVEDLREQIHQLVLTQAQLAGAQARAAATSRGSRSTSGQASSRSKSTRN